jgi:hypothetical protein
MATAPIIEITRWQRLLLAFCLLQLAWAAAGLVINPDFAIGADATSVPVLGVDFNGWHAVSGFLLFGPGLFAFNRDEIAVPYTWAAILALLATALWTVFSERPAWVFYFPNTGGDIQLHVGSALILALLLVIRRLDRSRTSAAS